MGGIFKNCLPVAFFLVAFTSAAPKEEILIEKRHFTTSQIIAEYGYSAASYFLKTEDGYLLQIHRVPHGENETISAARNEKKPAVLLLPGLYCSSYFYFFYQNQSLAFDLADDGYDVWVADFRGQSDPEAYGFYPDTFGPAKWQYTMDEMAKYDLPMFIDFVLKKTGQSKLRVIGHSLGNTILFMTLSSLPKYNDKVVQAIALAPAVYVAPHTGAAYFLTTSFVTRIIWEVINSVIGKHERLQVSGWEVRTIFMPCSGGSFLMELCRAILFSILGKDYNVPKEMIPLIGEQISSSSYLTYRQYLQHTEQGRFAMYDYGESANYKKYGSKKPPLYDLTQVTAPFILISGKTDAFTKDINVKFINKMIKKVTKSYYISDKEFNHFSFVASNKLKTLVNEPVINMLKSTKGEIAEMKKTEQDEKNNESEKEQAGTEGNPGEKKKETVAGPQGVQQGNAGGPQEEQKDNVAEPGGQKDNTGGPNEEQKDYVAGPQGMKKDNAGGPQGVQKDNVAGNQEAKKDNVAGGQEEQKGNEAGPQEVNKDNANGAKEAKKDVAGLPIINIDNPQEVKGDNVAGAQEAKKDNEAGAEEQKDNTGGPQGVQQNDGARVARKSTVWEDIENELRALLDS